MNRHERNTPAYSTVECYSLIKCRLGKVNDLLEWNHDSENVVEIEREKETEAKLTHEFNPELTDQQHQKIKDDIKREKEEFIKEQVYKLH